MIEFSMFEKIWYSLLSLRWRSRYRWFTKFRSKIVVSTYRRSNLHPPL